jgi:hexosaminidase
MTRRIISRAAAALVVLLATPLAAATVDVVPRPLSVVAGAGAGVRIDTATTIVTPPGDAGAARAAQELTILLEARRGKTAVASAHDSIVFARGDVSGGREAYRLTIADHRAIVTGATDAGLLYGAITLWQLATAADQPAAGPVDLAPLTIVDAPRFAWRGLLLDSARHYQSPAFIRRMIDWMALHKLNTLQWHLTDDQGWRLEIKHYPRLTSVGGYRIGRDGKQYGGFYTQAEVRAVVAYAAERNINIVPEIEMPGHALAAIRAYPKVGFAGVDAAAQGDWGVFPSIYRTDDATYAFLTTILGEVIDLFPSKVIAIGGDEAVKTQWHADAATQAQMHTLGLADETALQAWFVRRIGSFLNNRGRQLIGWDEILDGGGLPVNDTVLSWHGADGALAAARAGHDVVMATAPTLYFDNRQSSLPSASVGRGTVISLADVYAYDPGDPPLPKGAAKVPLTDAERAHIIGLQANIWTEHMATEANVERMALPRAAAVAESGWTATPLRDWANFESRLPAQFARYRALGLDADEGAVGVAIRGRRDGDNVRVRLASQTGLGDIRYTTDGSDPAPASTVAAGQIVVPLGTTVRAATYAGALRVSGVTERSLTAAALRYRISQELRPCTDRVVLNLVGPGGPFLADIMDTCWVWPAAYLDGVTTISAGVATLPFNFQLGDELKTVTLRPPATPAGELVVRLDSCTGPVVVTLPLAGVRAGAVTPLTAPLSLVGVHDLCLATTGRSPDPLHVVGWVRLEAAK